MNPESPVTDIEVPDNTLGARFLDKAVLDGRGDRLALRAYDL